MQVRFTPDVRPTTDASLDRNLALRLEYASLDVQVTDGVAVMFGLHETPWLTFEESVNRYRVLGPFFSERLGLIPGADRPRREHQGHQRPHRGPRRASTTARATAAPKSTSTRASMAARRSVRSTKTASCGNVTISGFYQYRLVRAETARATWPS